MYHLTIVLGFILILVFEIYILTFEDFFAGVEGKFFRELDGAFINLFNKGFLGLNQLVDFIVLLTDGEANDI